MAIEAFEERSLTSALAVTSRESVLYNRVKMEFLVSSDTKTIRQSANQLPEQNLSLETVEGAEYCAH